MGRKSILPYRWGGGVQLPLKIGAIVMPPQNFLVDKFCTEKSGESVHFLRSSVFWRDENNTPICGGCQKSVFWNNWSVFHREQYLSTVFRDLSTVSMELNGNPPFHLSHIYRNYSGCHCEGVFCPKQSRVEQEKTCFGRLLHSQKALVRSDTLVSRGWLNSYHLPA